VYDGHMDTDTDLALPDGTTFWNVHNECCGGPYPVALTPDGHRICAGCGDTMPGCDCRECSNERALDQDADAYFDREL
jgi:hypothetical protein